MDTPKGIFWLASYPKSGNTWFRIFLAHILNTSQAPIDPNHLLTHTIASQRQWVDQALGFDSTHLTHDELDTLRPTVYQWYGEQMTEPNYHKIHDAYTLLEDKTPLIPAQGCLGALYFIRNPLDIAISLANHAACSIDEAIIRMNNPQFAFCHKTGRQHKQLRQWLLSWSLHVTSWVQAKNIPLHIIRYEDMTYRPEETFTRALAFLQIDASANTIKKALANSHIKTIQQWEAQTPFKERPAKAERFFRKGIVGDWQNTLTDNQIQRIIQAHGDTMRSYGYLDHQNNPTLAYL